MGLKDCRVGVLMAVSDLATARRFYEDQLGLVPGELEQEGVRYFCAEGTSVFVYLQPHNAGASSATLAGWTVDDLDRTMDDLSSRGVRFEHYDQPGIKTDERGVFDGGDFRAAWIKDRRQHYGHRPTLELALDSPGSAACNAAPAAPLGRTLLLRAASVRAGRLPLSA